jgi:hypothetical protein
MKQLRSGLWPASQRLPVKGTIVPPRSRKKLSDVEAIPIIFLHRSNSEYLKYTFAQAKATNPKSDIVLLGDETNNQYPFVEHYFIEDYSESAGHFARVYKHLSTHSVDFELICFQRWFVLRDFMVAHGLRTCLFLDSDTLLYTDVTQDSRKFASFDFTLSQGTSGCTFFLNRLEALSEFCAFLSDTYTNRQGYHFRKMAAHFAVLQRTGRRGGVCDMTAFQLYKEDHFGAIGEVALVVEDSVYDPAITVAVPGFEMENGIKKIATRDGIPYGVHVKSQREIRFNSLQFQGSATKRLMRDYYTGPRELLDCAPLRNLVVDGTTASSPRAATCG